MSYKEKYLKYKTKYSLLKQQIGNGFIIGELDTNPPILFDYTEGKIIGHVQFVNSYYELLKDLYINFYENLNFSNFAIFLYYMFKIRIYLHIWESIKIANSEVDNKNQNTLNYSQLVEKIKQLPIYTTRTGNDGNFFFIKDSFVAHIESDISRELLAQHDNFSRTILNIIGPLMRYRINLQLEDTKRELQKNEQELEREVHQFESMIIEPFIQHLYTNIHTILQRQYGIVFASNIIEEFKEYYINIQKQDRIEKEIIFLFENLENVRNKLVLDRDSRYPDSEKDVVTLHTRFLIEFDILREMLIRENILS